MKKLCFLLFILTMTMGVTVGALAQTKQDESQKININKKGGIYDQKGTKLGFIDKNNVVRDNVGKELYFIDKDGNVIAANGVKLGVAKKNGFYYNNEGVNVINTKDLDKEKCAILDPQGHNMGTIHKNYKQHACAVHCFWLEKTKEKEAKKG